MLLAEVDAKCNAQSSLLDEARCLAENVGIEMVNVLQVVTDAEDIIYGKTSFSSQCQMKAATKFKKLSELEAAFESRRKINPEYEHAERSEYTAEILADDPNLQNDQQLRTRENEMIPPSPRVGVSSL